MHHSTWWGYCRSL